MILSGLSLLESVSPLVPDCDCSRSIFSLGNCPFKPEIAERMIFNLDCEAFDAKLGGWAFRNGPAL